MKTFHNEDTQDKGFAWKDSFYYCGVQENTMHCYYEQSEGKNKSIVHFRKLLNHQLENLTD